MPPGDQIIMLDLPSTIRFDAASSPGVLKVSYVDAPATPREEESALREPLDLWGAAWVLENDLPGRIVDVRPPRGLSRAHWRTLVLRLVALQECLDGFEFRMDGATRYLQEAAEIRGDIRSGLLFTYDRSNLHRGASGAKPGPESRLEAWIVEHGKKFLQGAFPRSMLRQYPASIFKTSLAEKNRATSKRWIDLVGVDKEGRLSAVGLHVGEDASLDLFAQGIDNALFCREFQKNIRRSWFPEVTSDRIALYLVADRFHPALLSRDGEPAHPLCEAIRPSDWLDIILVQVDTSGLPIALPDRVVFPPAI